MFKNLKNGIKLKLLVSSLVLSFLPFLIIGFFSWHKGREILEVQILEHLESVRDVRKSRLEEFFKEREEDTNVLLETVATLRHNAYQKLQIIQENKKVQVEKYFQERLNDIKVLAKSDSVSQALEQFEGALHLENDVDGLAWKSVAERVAPELQQYREEQGYHDLLLIVDHGHIVYTAKKGTDFGQDLSNGQLKVLQEAFEKQKNVNDPMIHDFKPYPAADNQYLAFLTAPIFRLGKRIGILALSLSADALNEIIHRKEGMGETGETYLVGELDGKTSYRNQRDVDGKQYTIGDPKTGEDIEKALNGEEGISVKTNIRNQLVLSAHFPLTIPYLKWCLVSNVGLEELLTPTLSTQQYDFFTYYVQVHGYHDLLLIHPNGDIFYSVKKEDDYGTNILDGNYSHTQLSTLVKQVLKTKKFGISDYALYEPSNNVPSAFIAQPLLHENEVELIVTLQIYDSELEKILKNNNKNESSQEVYLVGTDHRLRSDVFYEGGCSVADSFGDKCHINSSSVEAALAGQTGRGIIQDFRRDGHLLLSTYTPIKVNEEVTWALVAEMHQFEAFIPIRQFELVIGLISIFGMVTITIFAWLLSQGITYPLGKLITLSKAIATGHLENHIEITGKDEINQLMSAFADMQCQLQKRITEDKQITEEALRINSALDNATTSILITDTAYNIIYCNQAAKHLFEVEEQQIRTIIPNFSASHLLGSNVDFFHKNPAYQRQLLANIAETRHARVIIGKVILDHVITPVLGNEGERLGIVIEFTNRTVEVAMEQEIDVVIQAASQGDFKQYISLDNKMGFFKTFSASVNKIIEFNQTAIEDTMRMFAALAAGDLTQTIEREYVGAFEQLKRDANATVEKLTDIMLTIQHTADNVSTSAQEISRGNTSLSQRTEQQAASLEETSASMEQMTGTVQQNADNARQASMLAVEARERAIQGGEAVQSTIMAMAEISNSSQEITDIIGVIDEIAFQTNLLALNAAVEAARAGEQGRGFAVVAQEVRNLAQRSAGAAKEIKNLIQDSVAKVGEGTRLADKSGEALQEIVAAVKKVSDIISEISAASQEQSAGIHQVNKAIAQMDEMTQQNASLVQEAASASQSMAEQAQNLKMQVTFFNIKHKEQEKVKQVPLKKAVVTKKSATPPHTHSHKDSSGWEDF